MALELPWVETIMFPYNIVEDQAKELIHACAEKNIGFIAMKPLAGGAIEDAVTALRCVCANPDVTVVIPGMADIAELNQNLAAVTDSSPLSVEEEAKMRAIRDALGTQFCRRCNYCQPCSAGISISSVFLFEGYLSRYGLADWARSRYATLTQKASGVHRLRRLRKPLPLPSAHPQYAERGCGKVRRIKENIHEAVNCAPRRPGLFHRFPDRDRLDRSGAAVRPPVQIGCEGVLLLPQRAGAGYRQGHAGKAGAAGGNSPWLREFSPQVLRPGKDKPGVAWDWLPQDWTADKGFYDREHWWENDRFTAAGVREEAQWVWDGLDELLARHGYRREGEYYRAEQPNEDTVVLFCHFGVTCVLLSHLLGISPMPLWQGTCSLPTSVTILNTEERREGIASFRMTAFGDTSHLYAAGREPSFSGRFCETYENWEQRHD